MREYNESYSALTEGQRVDLMRCAIGELRHALDEEILPENTEALFFVAIPRDSRCRGYTIGGGPTERILEAIRAALVAALDIPPEALDIP